MLNIGKYGSGEVTEVLYHTFLKRNKVINNSNSNRELIGIVDEYRKSENYLSEKGSNEPSKRVTKEEQLNTMDTKDVLKMIMLELIHQMLAASYMERTIMAH